MTTEHPAGVPFGAVLFDLHSTLIDQGSGAEWLRQAWRRAGHADDPVAALGESEAARLAHALERIWDTARDIDPASDRDLDPTRHRAVFDELVRRMGGIDPDLSAALYDTFTAGWTAYDDSAPVLEAVKVAGLRTAVLSNIGIDVREVLERTGLAPYLDAVVFSCEVGVTKPQRSIFLKAVELLGSTPEATLMVGDKWQDDGGAAGAGIRTLILPATSGPVHGLGLVCRLLGILEPA